jgi:hypothetical protein
MIQGERGNTATILRVAEVREEATGGLSSRVTSEKMMGPWKRGEFTHPVHPTANAGHTA